MARPALPSAVPTTLTERIVEQIADDREHILPGDTLLLIVEDDPHYARILMDIAHEEGFKVVTASRGEDAAHLLEACWDGVAADAVGADNARLALRLRVGGGDDREGARLAPGAPQVDEDRKSVV